MIKLDSSIRLILVQFRCSNSDFIPKWIPRKEPKRRERQTPCGKKGELVISPTENCCLLELAHTLKKSKYNLVDSFFQEYGNHTVVAFTFVRKEYLRVDAQGLTVGEKEKISEGFEQICNEALWKTQAFINPFYKDGKEIPGQHSISINAVARRPLFDQEGERLKVWERNEDGNKIGDEPVKMEPDHMIEIVDEAISIF